MNTIQQLVFTLATSKAKKITPKMVAAVATKLGVKKNVAERAWKNYSQLDVKSENFDRRFTSGTYVGKRKPKEVVYAKNWMKTKFPHPTRVVYFKTAAKVIMEIKDTDKQVYEVLDKYRVSRTQYYNWLEELNISGKLLGHVVFDWTKFPKKDVKNVIKYCKYPDRFINYSVLDTAQLERLNTVMDEYL